MSCDPSGALAGRLRAEARPRRQEQDDTVDMEWGSGKGCCISLQGSNRSNGPLKTSVLKL